MPPAAGCERLEKNVAVARDSVQIQGCAGSGGHEQFAMLLNLTSRPLASAGCMRPDADASVLSALGSWNSV